MAITIVRGPSSQIASTVNDGYVNDATPVIGGTGIGGNGSDAAGVNSKRIDTIVQQTDLDDCKVIFWDVTAATTNTLDTGLSAASGARVVTFGLMPSPVTNLTSLAANTLYLANINASNTSSNISASMSYSTGVITFTVSSGSPRFTVAVWYK